MLQACRPSIAELIRMFRTARSCQPLVSVNVKVYVWFSVLLRAGLTRSCRRRSRHRPGPRSLPTRVARARIGRRQIEDLVPGKA